jgi:hypothetical protein
VTDVFHRAGITLDRERRILTGEIDLQRPPLPAEERQPWPDCSRELTDANAQYHPAVLFPGTRAAGLKKIVLRVMNVYTYRQILFNAAVVRILNRWDARLRLLVTETGSLSEHVAEWLEGRIARIEERRGLWEARLASQLGALEDRASAAESDVAALEARARDDRARIDALEDSIRRLEGRLEREREGAGTGVLR